MLLCLHLSPMLLSLLLDVQVLRSGYVVGQACIKAYSDFSVGGKALKYGWGYADAVGNYGDNYLARAVAAYVGLGANWLNITIYPATLVSVACSVMLGWWQQCQAAAALDTLGCY
jgi:hypothetical protein